VNINSVQSSLPSQSFGPSQNDVTAKANPMSMSAPPPADTSVKRTSTLDALGAGSRDPVQSAPTSSAAETGNSGNQEDNKFNFGDFMKGLMDFGKEFMKGLTEFGKSLMEMGKSAMSAVKEVVGLATSVADIAKSLIK
jgi:hypothetical protein